MPFLLAYCSSFFVMQWQTSLPSANELMVLLPVFFAGLIIHQCVSKRLIKKIAQSVIGFLLGYCWLTLYSYDQLSHQLPMVQENQQLLLTLKVSSLVAYKGHYQQFSADLLSSQSLSLEPLRLKKVLLNFYRSKKEGEEAVIKPCDVLHVKAKLKRPRGLSNLAGFDYGQYLFEQGYDAKGYITSIEAIMPHEGSCVQKLRQSYRDYVLTVLPKASASWLLALTVGDKSTFTKEQKKLLVETGLSHLFVISGMHIGIIAGFVYGLVLLLRRLGGGLILRGDWRFVAACCAMMAAFGYALLAGFSYSTQRALIAVVAFMLVSNSRLHLSLWLRYGLTMAITLTASPLSPLNTGFILSFYAVFVIMLVASQYRRMSTWAEKIKIFIAIQVALFIALLPLSLFYFQTVSLISPLMNVWMIPLLSFVITPVCLIVACLWFLGLDVNYLLILLGEVFEYIFYGVSGIVKHWPTLSIIFYALTVQQMVILIVGAMMFCMPRFLPSLRLLACGLFFVVGVSVFYQKTDKAPLSVDVLDVGQGMAVVIRTPQHAMLYDTGAGWVSGSMGAWVAVPVLRKMGVTTLDQIMISHLDNDHAGGFDDVVASVEVREVVSSENIPVTNFVYCQNKKPWVWEDVSFTVIHPKDFEVDSRNNQSCVLQIEYKGKKVLLVGDIEKDVELQLIADNRLSNVDILLVPHHGSATSSTEAFVEVTAPHYAIISSGYLNRYRHPKKKVVDRYLSAGSTIFNTAHSGGISFIFNRNGGVVIRKYREDNKRFWHD